MLHSFSSQHYLEKENFPYFYNHVHLWQVERSCAWLWTALESRRVLRKQEVLGTFQTAVHQMLKSKYTRLAGTKSQVSDAGGMTFLMGICTLNFSVQKWSFPFARTTNRQGKQVCAKERKVQFNIHFHRKGIAIPQRCII